MDTYKFYYDESEHSRKINYATVTAPNYYDNFVTVVIGWLKEKEKQVILLRYFRGKTQTEVAKMMGVNQVQVSRMERKGLEMMKRKLTRDNAITA